MTTHEMGSGPAGEQGGARERTVEAVAEADAAAMHVADVAGDEAGKVARDAKDAARGFFEETRTQLSEQASSQQQRAAEALRATGDEFSEMAQSSGASGMATGVVRGLGDHTKRAASWLEQREPGDLVREVRGFARRHTGVFLVAALGVGLVAGRLTRALVSNGDGSGGAADSSAGGQSGASREPRATPVTAGGAGAVGGVGASGGTGASGGVSASGGTGAAGAGIGGQRGEGALGGASPEGEANDAGTLRRGMSRPDVLPADASAQDEWAPRDGAQR
ncbi:hypothetical protein K0817_015875 [Microbacterium sp. HD4P20]|uniref:hypothetical protein n=1 Tax=Microbacterium sp. HD4P20 TaxID=2864874 RepID=UPI001C63E854|nr:hypothetical protein [Microbacterium sp. HD4P20]MCP2638032.1 hypothetical protein [Microbacterium sp. HD4P20]